MQIKIINHDHLKYFGVREGDIYRVLRIEKGGAPSNFGYWIESPKGEVKILEHECTIVSQDQEEKTKNIKLEKAKGKGWFLEIEGFTRIALTSVEAWSIYKVIKDQLPLITMEMEEK